MSSDAELHVDSQDGATLEHRRQQQQLARDSSPDERATSDLQTGSRFIATAAGSQPVRQTSSDCASTSSSSTAATTLTQSTVSSATGPTSSHCSVSPPNICPPFYPVYPPYIVMGIPVQPFAYHPPHSDPVSSLGRATGSRKRPGNRPLPAEVKRRPASRRQRPQRGDVVSSTTPDSSLLETASSVRPTDMTSSATRKAKVTSPVVSREKPVYDWCGALDLSMRK